MNRDWKWTQASDEEFEKLRFDNTYYRIYHKDANGNDVVDYKFWGKDDNAALDTLKEFKLDHQGDGNAYYYATSGYFCSPNGGHFDTMDEMGKSLAQSPYDEECRKYDYDRIDEFLEDACPDLSDGNDKDDATESEASRRSDVLDSLLERAEHIIAGVVAYKGYVEKIRSEVECTDRQTASEDEIDDIVMKTMEANEMFYDLEDTEFQLRTNHRLSESWNLDSHILEDIRFNVKKLLDDDGMSCPMQLMQEAADKLKIAVDEKSCAANSKDNARIYNEANKMWREKMTELYTDIMSYSYYNVYGIVDDDDEELAGFNPAEPIPYKEGTLDDIDYAKLHEMMNLYWGKIWTWMSQYGYYLGV